MEGKKPRRRFDLQFKLDAVRLMTEGGRSMSAVSRDLGVGCTQLANWKKKYGDRSARGNDVPTSPSPVTPSAAEIEKLRRELAQVKEEREILKKALAVFSRRPE